MPAGDATLPAIPAIMSDARAGPRGHEVLESRNQRARWSGAAVLGNRRGADLAGRPAAGPRPHRRVGRRTCRGELQREPKRDGYNPRRAPTEALSGSPGRGAQPDPAGCGCCWLCGESTPCHLRRSHSTAAKGGLASIAEGARCPRTAARSTSRRATAHEPATGNGRKQADPLGLERRNTHQLESDSFP